MCSDGRGNRGRAGGRRPRRPADPVSPDGGGAAAASADDGQADEPGRVAQDVPGRGGGQRRKRAGAAAAAVSDVSSFLHGFTTTQSRARICACLLGARGGGRALRVPSRDRARDDRDQAIERSSLARAVREVSCGGYKPAPPCGSVSRAIWWWLRVRFVWLCICICPAVKFQPFGPNPRAANHLARNRNTLESAQHA